MTLKSKFQSFMTSLSISWCTHVNESVSSWAAVTEILLRTHACSSPCFECAGLFCMKGLTCQWSPVWYFIILCSLCCGLSLHFLVCDISRDNLSTCSLQPKFSHVSLEKTTPGESVFSLCHCHWSCFEHVLHFWCNFPECEGKLNISELFLQISH